MPLPTMDELIAYLRRGKENAITANEIAEHFGVSDGGVEVPIRDVIREAIADGALIGSTNRGFFIIDNEEEFEDYIESLESRQEGIGRRIRHLRNNWNNR